MITHDQALKLAKGDVVYHALRGVVWTETFVEIEQEGDGWARIQTTGVGYLAGEIYCTANGKFADFSTINLYFDKDEAESAALDLEVKWSNGRLLHIEAEIAKLKAERDTLHTYTPKVDWPGRGE